MLIHFAEAAERNSSFQEPPVTASLFKHKLKSNARNKLLKMIPEIKFTCKVILYIVDINGTPAEEHRTHLQRVNSRSSSLNIYTTIK